MGKQKMDSLTQDHYLQQIKPFLHNFNDPEFVECFVENGFVILKQILPPALVHKHFEFVSSRYEELRKDFQQKHPDKKLPVLGISNHILKEFERDPLFDQLVRNKNLLDALEKLLGPDLAKTNSNSIFINDPVDDSPVTAKELHQEAWSGSTVDDIQIWVPYHPTDPKTTMGVVPESHYYGFFPNRNRKPIIPEGFEMPETIPMHPLEPGDVILFHGLLFHGATKRGDRTRYALVFRFRSSFAPVGLYRSQGFTTIRNGPMTRICTALGNDLLSPLRTYGGNISNEDKYEADI